MTQTILGVFETFERLSVGYPHIGTMWTVIVEDCILTAMLILCLCNWFKTLLHNYNCRDSSRQKDWMKCRTSKAIRQCMEKKERGIEKNA